MPNNIRQEAQMNAMDRIDYEIVRLLRKNARISNKDLAQQVSLAPSTCLVRTRLLQQDGVITGFKAEVNPAKLGVGLQAMISVRLKRHFKPDVEAFRQHALELPEVVRFYHVAGPIDFLVHVWTRDSEHLRNLAMTAFTAREEVSHIETELIFEHVSCQELPSFVGEL
jgi:DNA-binding Lrp family transcriptional regulator